MTTRLTRRSLLQGLGATAAVPLVPTASATEQQDAAFDPARQPQRAVFHQQVYFNFDGNGETYTPPRKNDAGRPPPPSRGQTLKPRGRR
jgi:hypothetical protein